jgi:hypothetical protein
MTRSGLWCIVFAFLFPLAHLATSQTLGKQEQAALLNQANRAFGQALESTVAQEAQGYYQQAIDRYAQLLATGLDNAKLYYNLGNAYFLRHELGHAIVQYRRGLRLEPGNRRLQANLRYALSQRMDQFDTSASHALVSRLLFWQNALNLQTQVTLAMVGYLGVWACVFAHLFWHRRLLLWLTVGAVCVFLLFAGSALSVHAEHTSGGHGVVVTPEAFVRKGNGESYALQFPQPLHSGAEFTVLEERGPWLHIRIENGATGWIRRDYAALW